jgi:hypothetical protein
MAYRTISYRLCDGCLKDDLNEGVEIISTELKGFSDTQTLDLCADCSDEGKYICNLCHDVHDDDHPCDRQKSRLMEVCDE